MIVAIQSDSCSCRKLLSHLYIRGNGCNPALSLLVDQVSACCIFGNKSPDSKVHGANMGPTLVLSSPDGPHDDPRNLAMRVITQTDAAP